MKKKMEKEIQNIKEMELQKIQNNQEQPALSEKSRLTRFLVILVISLVLGLVSINSFFVLLFTPLFTIPNLKTPAGLAAQTSSRNLKYRK